MTQAFFFYPFTKGIGTRLEFRYFMIMGLDVHLVDMPDDTGIDELVHDLFFSLTDVRCVKGEGGAATP